MLKPILLLTIATTLSTRAMSTTAMAAEVGLLVSVKGKVQVYRPAKDKWSKASVMESLADGGKIKVEPNSEAKIALFKNGACYQLAPGSVTIIAAETCKTSSGPAAKALPALPLRRIKDLAASRVATGRPGGTVIRTDLHDIELQSLAHTATLDAQPLFKWQAVNGATSYKIKVWDEKDEQIWQGDTATTSLKYPADAPALKSGIDYIWRVSVIVNGTRYFKEAVFRVLTDAERNAVLQDVANLPADVDEAVTQVLVAEIYARHELWDNAIAVHEQLALRYPDAAAIHFALANLLAEQGRMAQSREAQKFAKQIGEE